ncbi:MAG: ankyrin repeat domain-containing protein [Acidobacteria bacterium]|nr:ankyrin repeat domain-containing protein [Acidobacteriota bacterium]
MTSYSPTRVSLGYACAVCLAVVATASGATGQSATVLRAPLAAAVQAGDRLQVERLLSQAIDVNAAEPDGTTPLHWAVQRDDAPLTARLLEAGADVNAPNRYQVTPLSLAALNGSVSMVDRLLEAGADPQQAALDGETPLLTAARTGIPEVVERLITHGADPNAREGWRGQTALMWAAAEGHPGVARLLVEHGADVRASTNDGFTPLLFAARRGDIETTRVLLDAGVPVTENAPDGTSVLVLAILNAHYELAGLLLDAGADPNVADARGSALHVLAWVRRPGTPSTTNVMPRVPTGTLDSLALAGRLLQAGADPDARIAWEEPPFDKVSGRVRVPEDVSVAPTYLSWVGATPFFVAAKHADVPLMQLLVEHGANPVLATPQNITPLMAAAGLGYWLAESPGSEVEALAAVKLAVELGADVNAATDFEAAPLGDLRWGGSTALHGAVIRDAPSVVRYLVEQGASLDMPNSQGWTPLDMTRGVFVANTQKTYDEVGRLLEALGADASASGR